MNVPTRPSRSTRDWLTIAALVVTFIVTILVNLRFYMVEEMQFIHNDVGYYGYHLNTLLNDGDNSVMAEYPMPAVWILLGIYLLGGGWEHWLPLFAWLMVAIIAAVAVLLHRRDRPGGALFWILFIGASGPLLWFRFDLVPAALVALACLWVSSHPRTAGALIALGASIKLWPALLAFPMAAPNPLKPGNGRSRTLGFLVAGAALGLSSLLVVGWSRSASPITWQSDRGLQMESVPATPLMFLRTFTSKQDWPVDLSEFNAIEVYGPGVDFLLQVSTALTAGTLALTLWLTWRLVRRLRDGSQLGHEALLLALLAILLAMVVANKTLSPQYIPWLGGPVAALLATARSHWLRRHVLAQAVGMVIVAGCTHLTYPWFTQGIMTNPNGQPFETAVLLLRNLLLVALLVHAVALALRATSRRLDDAPNQHPPA